MESLSIDVKKREPLALVRLWGFFAGLQVYPLKKQVETLFSQGCRYLIFDLSALRFMDTAGLGALIQFHESSREHMGCCCVIQSPAENIQQVFETVSAGHVLDLQPDLPTALERMRKYSGLPLSHPDPHESPEEITPIPVAVSRQLTELTARVEALEQAVRALQTSVPAPDSAPARQ